MKQAFSSLPLFILLIAYPGLAQMDHYLDGITAQMFFYVALCGCGIRVFVQKKEFRLGWADLLLISFTAWYGFRIIVAEIPMDKWTVLSVAAGILFYFHQRNNRNYQPLWFLLFVAGIVQSGWFLLQTQGVCTSYNLHFEGTGSFNNPAILAIFLVLSLFAGVYLFKKKSLIKHSKWGIAAGMILMSYCILQTGSRASWVALFVGCAWMFGGDAGKLIRCYTSTWLPWKKTAGNIAGLLIIGGGLFFLSQSLYSLRPESVNGRILIWQVAIDLWQQAPWMGEYSFQSRYMPAQAEWFRVLPGSEGVATADNNIHVFNEFLKIACESGTIGLLLFWGLIGYVCTKAFRGNHEARSGGGVLIILLTFGCFSYPFSIESLTFIALLMVAIVTNETETKPLFRCSSKWLKYGTIACITGITTFCSIEYLFEKEADLFLSEIQHSPSRLTEAETSRYANRMSGNPDFMLCYARTLYNNALYQEALPALEQAFRLKPSSQIVCHWGMCCEQKGLFHEAKEKYLMASCMVPGHILPPFHLFCLYRKTKQTGKATEIARQLITMPVKVVNTTVLRVRSEAKKFLNQK